MIFFWIHNIWFLKIIRERRAELQEEQKMPQETDEFERKSLNFLDQILTITREDGTSFTDQEISDNLYTMMSAVGIARTKSYSPNNALLFL